jgi:orotate phosphoribosyltransferase
MLYSQQQDFTFDLTYAQEEVTAQYLEFNGNRMPYDDIVSDFEIEIDRYEKLVHTLMNLPPSLKQRPATIVSLMERDSTAAFTDSLLANPSFVDTEDNPFLLDEAAQIERDSCLFYAQKILQKKDDGTLQFDMVFGPAYKGIPLTVAATIAISDEYGKDIKYTSNRKEVKDHGDKGILLGSPIQDGDRVVIIEDVTTAGTSIRETVPIIKAQGDVSVIGLVVSVDRMERGTGDESALAEIAGEFGMKTTAIVTMEEVIEHLYNREYKGRVIIDDTIKAAIDEYYRQYGAR